MSEALGKHQCAACGTVRKTNNLRYDPNTFLPYCQHAEICSPEHPNSPANILERGTYLNLITLKEAEDLYREKLLIEHPDAEAVEDIRKLLDKPTSLRVQSPDLAKYLVQVKKDYNIPTMAETVRYLLTTAMESHGVFYKERKETYEQERKRQHIKSTLGDLVQPVREGKPQLEKSDDDASEKTGGSAESKTDKPASVERPGTHTDLGEPNTTTPTDMDREPVGTDDGGWSF